LSPPDDLLVLAASTPNDTGAQGSKNRGPLYPPCLPFPLPPARRSHGLVRAAERHDPCI